MTVERLVEVDELQGAGLPTTGAADSRRRRSRRAQLNERRSQIIKVFAELGMVDLLEQSGLSQHVPALLGTHGGEDGRASTPVRLRRALEQLGGAFVKLGQTLSVRPDLVPREYLVELEKMQDEIAPMSFGMVRQIVESELECSLEDAYASLSRVPLGSASIAQVHAAVLQDGTEVVVKVQRPEAARLIDLDLDLMAGIANRLSAAPWAGDIDVLGFVTEFAQAVRSELDFTEEARNLDRFGAYFAESGSVVIPVAYWDHTTSRLLTESRLDGIPFSRPEDIRQAGGDVHQLIEHGVDAYLRMVFELRRFHSDPHPGNLIALDGDAIGFVDFGRVSSLSERSLDRLADCFIAFAQNDSEALTDAVLRLVSPSPITAAETLREDIEKMMDRYAEADVASSTGTSVISETLEIMRQHQLHLPSQYAMLFQTLAVLQGVVLTLDPETMLLKMMEPYVERVALQRYTPERVGKSLLRNARQYGRAAALIPSALESVLQRIAASEMAVKVDVDASEDALDRAEAMANRFSLTLLLSAMAIALALVDGRVLPGWMGYATHTLLFLVFFVGVWHFASILAAERRSRQRKRRPGSR